MLQNLPNLKPWKQSKINLSVLGKKNLILTSTVQFQNVVHRRVDSKANSQNISSGITRGSIFCMINSLSMYSAAILRTVSSAKVIEKKHLVSKTSFWNTFDHHLMTYHTFLELSLILYKSLIPYFQSDNSLFTDKCAFCKTCFSKKANLKRHLEGISSCAEITRALHRCEKG